MREFSKNFITVFLGSIISQLIPISGTLIVARIYSPAAFGAFASWISLVTFTAIVSTLRLENSLPILKNRKLRVMSVFIIIIITFIVSLSLSIIFLIIEYYLSISIYMNYKSVFIYLISPCAFFISLNILFQTWAAIESAYKFLNIIRGIQASFVVGIQIIIGSYDSTESGLILSFVLANILSAIFSAILMYKFYITINLKYNEIGEFLKRFKKLIIFALPADSLNALVGQLPILVVSYRFGSEVSGFLSLTMRIFGGSVGLICKSALDVFKSHAAKDLKENGNCNTVYSIAFLILGLISFFISFFVYFFYEKIFSIFFGDQWKLSGLMALWLLPMFALRLVANPLSYLVYLVEKNYIDLYWQFGLFIVCIATLSIFPSVKETIIAYGVGYSIMYTIYIYISHKFSKC